MEVATTATEAEAETAFLRLRSAVWHERQQLVLATAGKKAKNISVVKRSQKWK